MLDCIVKRPEKPSAMTKSYFYELIDCLCEHFVLEKGDKRLAQLQNETDERMNEILLYIEEHYSEQISLKELAERLHLTYSYLSRHFKKVFGTNFLEYVSKVRLHHVVEDLIYTEKPITHIAVDNGYVNASSLNKAFKEAYHTTPTAYRARMLKQQQCLAQRSITRNESMYQQVKAYLAQKGVEGRQASHVQQFSIRVNGAKKEPYTKNWMEMINLGRASDLTKAKVQEQVLFLRDTLGFRYVRFWSLFNNEMELRPEHQTNVINFDRVDEVLDFLVYHNLIPFIELGDKPKHISRTATDAVYFEEGKLIFSNPKEFESVLTRFMHHVITRYRLEEVRKWRFECWMDHRIYPDGEPVPYFEVFNSTSRVIHSILPDAMVGGCGMKCNDQEMGAFLKGWKLQPCQPDFFSIMSYPYEPSEDVDGVLRYTQLSTDSQFLKRQLQNTKRLMLDAGMDMPVYITEWNCTISSRNYLNDTCYKGAYLLKNIIDLLGEVDVLGYWAASDLVSTYYDSQNILNGCPGLLSKDNICKSAYYAYRFLRRMGDYLVEAGENYLITTSGHFSYYIICLNHRPLDYRYYRKPENAHSVEEILALTQSNPSIRMKFHLDNLPDDRYIIKTSVISPHYGSVLDEWMRLNTMTNIRQEDINYLKRICTPHMSIREMDTQAGQLQFEMELEAEEISLIHIYHKV